MAQFPVHAVFPGKLVMVGCGSIGQGVMPLILWHIGITPDRIAVVTSDERGHQVANEYGVRFIKHPLTKENYRSVLTPLLQRGDFLLNLSVDVSSIDLVALCIER